MNRQWYTPEDDEEYLDDAERAHKWDLWSLAEIFEGLKDGEDTKYRDYSVGYHNDWKIVAFEIALWPNPGEYAKLGKDLFAVRRR